MDKYIVFMQNYPAPCTWLAIHNLGLFQQCAQEEYLRVKRKDYTDNLGKVT